MRVIWKGNEYEVVKSLNKDGIELFECKHLNHLIRVAQSECEIVIDRINDFRIGFARLQNNTYFIDSIQGKSHKLTKEEVFQMIEALLQLKTID